MITIKARVKYYWNHRNCKFFPGDEVYINEGYGFHRLNQLQRLRVGEIGIILAVTCAADGKIRGGSGPDAMGRRRCHTRYYVLYKDGQIFAVDPFNLSKVQPVQKITPPENIITVPDPLSSVREFFQYCDGK